MKHNKKRNSIFLYEVLIRELTKAVINKDEALKNKITGLIKSSFRRGTLLYEEWKSYKALMGVKTNRKLAERLVEEVIKDYSEIDKDKLFQEQSVLIKKINKTISPAVYTNFVPNYRSMATIYQIFNNKMLSPHKRIVLEEQLISEMCEDIEERKDLQPISKLALKTFSEKFNTVYSALLQEQRKLLELYVLGDKNNVEFKVFLNEELGRLKKVVQSSLMLEESKGNEEINSKTTLVLQILDEFKNKPIDQDMITQVLKIQQLSNEIETNGY